MHLKSFLVLFKVPLFFFLSILISFLSCSLRPWNIFSSSLSNLGSFTPELLAEWRRNSSAPASRSFSSPSDLCSAWTAGALRLSSSHRFAIFCTFNWQTKRQLFSARVVYGHVPVKCRLVVFSSFNKLMILKNNVVNLKREHHFRSNWTELWSLKRKMSSHARTVSAPHKSKLYCQVSCMSYSYLKEI